MRRHLGSLLPALTLVAALAASLAACGDDDTGSVAKDPATTASTASQQTESPTDPSEEPFGYRLVDMITVTAAGGQPSAEASALGDDASVRRFVAQFTNDGLARQVRDSVARTEVPEGQTLYGAVVALGCDSPTDVEVDVTAGGVAITAQPVPSPLPECLAPMTTVALVLVDA